MRLDSARLLVKSCQLDILLKSCISCILSEYYLPVYYIVKMPTGPRSGALPHGLMEIRSVVRNGDRITSDLMRSIGVRVRYGNPMRVSAHDVIHKICGITNRYDMWARLMARDEVKDQIREHCVFSYDTSGREQSPMLDGMGVMLVANSLQGRATSIFRAECSFAFMHFMNGAVDAVVVDNTPLEDDIMARDVSVNDDTPTTKTLSGHVYIMRRLGHLDVKIGMTTKSEKELRAQYSRAGYGSGAYNEFEFFGPCLNPRLAEKMVHDELKHYRHNKGTEWFVASDDQEMNAFRQIIKDVVDNVNHDGHITNVPVKRRRERADVHHANVSAEQSHKKTIDNANTSHDSTVDIFALASKYREHMVDAGMWGEDAKQIYKRAMDKALCVAAGL